MTGGRCMVTADRDPPEGYSGGHHTFDEWWRKRKERVMIAANAGIERGGRMVHRVAMI